MTDDQDGRLARAERYVFEVERLFREQLARVEHLAARGEDTEGEEERLRRMQRTFGAVDLDRLRGKGGGPETTGA